MSAYPQAPSQAIRPGTLKAAIGLAVVAGVAAIVNLIMVYAAGTDIVSELVAKEIGVTVDEIKALADEPQMVDAFDEAKDKLQNRALPYAVSGALLLLFGLLMNKAAKWSRVLVTITAVLTILWALVVTINSTTMMLAFCVVAIAASVFAIVLTWLPPNGRYAKAAKAGG